MQIFDLPNYVKATAAQACSLDLGTFIAANSFPLLAEIKYDGRRVFLIKTGDKIVMPTKHSSVYMPHQFPKLFAELAKLPVHKAILDCELIPSTQTLYVFDMLAWEGHDLQNTYNLKERRAELLTLCPSAFTISEHVKIAEAQLVYSIAEIEQYKAQAIAQGYEGIMLKNLCSYYGQKDWMLKLKKFKTIDVYVTGPVENKDSYAFYIASNSKGQKLDLGRVGSFIKSVDPSKIRTGQVLEVQYQEITKERNLRHPFVIRVRDDKSPAECDFEREVGV